MKGFLSNIFSSDDQGVLPSDGSPLLKKEIDKDFLPSKGDFFRTREYPEINEKMDITGKVWLEAAYDAHAGHWILWKKSIRKVRDILEGGESFVISTKVLFPETNFITAYDQMTTFEAAQKSLGIQPMQVKTPAKLGGDYYRQFAWREGLMMSRSGRLYPFTDENLKAANYFNEQDIKDATAFLNRLKIEQFVPVPITLPSGNWDKMYEKNKQRTDARLNALYARYKEDKNNHDLALQIIGQETVEVLYAHMQRGFEPKIFEKDKALHFALLQAAIDRPDVNPLGLLSEAGISFYVSHKGETPVEHALQKRRYSHLYTMLSRDSTKLANYRDENGDIPAKIAMQLQDRQAFKMLYLEGLDYAHVDAVGYALVHHAFENNFLSGIYAWLDEGLAIDTPIYNKNLTGLSIARHQNNQPLIDFALAHGANKDAPLWPEIEVQTKSNELDKKSVTVLEFSLDLLAGPLNNKEIEDAAVAYVKAGGNINLLDKKGLSVLELCWMYQKNDSELNRRNLISGFGKMGADPSMLLSDGTTLLTRITSGAKFDVDFLKAVAPYASNPNNPDDGGNNLLHALQMNASEAVSHSNNVVTILNIFPTLDLNLQNKDGLSNVGLAIRLNRSQTLKNISPSIGVDWSQITSDGWSMLDLAFTSAVGVQTVSNVPRAEKIKATSDALKTVVLDLLEKSTKKETLSQLFAKQRPDSQTLWQAIDAEQVPANIVKRLKNTIK